MYEKKEAQRYDARYLMQLSQKKCVAKFYSHSFSFYNLFELKEILEPKS